MPRTHRSLLAKCLFLPLIAGCGATGLVTSIEIKITPSTRTLSPGQSATFKGTETTTDLTGFSINTEADAFDWELDENDGGRLMKTSAETTSYTYTAPAIPGIYHLQIRSKKAPTQTARATITVN